MMSACITYDGRRRTLPIAPLAVDSTLIHSCGDVIGTGKSVDSGLVSISPTLMIRHFSPKNVVHRVRFGNVPCSSPEDDRHLGLVIGLPVLPSLPDDDGVRVRSAERSCGLQEQDGLCGAYASADSGSRAGARWTDDFGKWEAGLCSVLLVLRYQLQLSDLITVAEECCLRSGQYSGWIPPRVP